MFGYDIPEDGWDIILSETVPEYTVQDDAVEELRWTALYVPYVAGLTYDFDYDAWFYEVYPDFDER